MKRRIAIAILGLVASPLAMLTTPAQASHGVCAGTGTLTTPALVYPAPVGGPANSGTIGGSLGICTGTSAPASVGGSVNGNCGRSSGTVTINGAHSTAFTTAGSIVVIGPGALVGAANAVPAVGQSCLTGATLFQVTGAVA